MTKGFAVKLRKIAAVLMVLAIAAMAAGIFSGCESKAEPEEVMLSVWCAENDIPMISQMIDELKELHKNAAYHHEKWDGTGYNKGLSGKDIPLCARIMSIADVFDALISKRCYKEKIPIDEAFKIIEESGGTHFDPTLTSIFLDIRPQIEEYLRSINELKRQK